MNRSAFLVIDTSTDQCSAAVCLPYTVGQDDMPAAALSATGLPAPAVRDDVVAGCRVVALSSRTGAVSSQHLLPAVQRVLAAAGITLADCGAIGFGAGPGSFTGVRTATGAAQGMAFAAGIPLVPIDTLMACAESARLRASSANRTGTSRDGQLVTQVLVAIDARMGECYSASFDWSGDEWQTVSPARVGAPGTVTLPQTWQSEPGEPALAQAQRAAAGRSTGTVVLAGNAAAVFGEALTVAASIPVHDADALADIVAFASLGWRSWLAGDAVPAAQAQPFYVRDKVALTTVERAVEKAAKAAAAGPVDKAANGAAAGTSRDAALPGGAA